MNNGNYKKLKSYIAILICAWLTGCATTGIDPYEDINRDVFTFNDTVDEYFAKPISDTYKWVTPQFVRTGIFNFFNNLNNVNVIINDVLQAKFEQSAEDMGRLLINTTVGLGGLIDVAEDAGLKQNNEDFDQTLAVWGVPQGPYMVIPLLGPTTLRGIPGSIFDTAANPTSYVGMPIQLISLLNTRANAQSSLDVVKEGALDPYVFIREGYLQTREHLATDGKSQSTIDIDAEYDDKTHHSTTKNDKPSEEIASSSTTTNTNYTLRLSPDEQQKATSFGHVTKSFESTANSFAEANRKLEQFAEE